MTAAAQQRPELLNLRGLSILLLQGSDIEMVMLVQVLGGLGCWSPVKCTSGQEAMLVLGQREIDMVIVDAGLPDQDGYTFIQTLRRSGLAANRAVPIILLAGHIRTADVQRARDCGANLILVKPATPQIIYERVAWLARDTRPFIDCPAYCGPDRRFQRLGPPLGTKGRRAGDLAGKVGEATEPNMSQIEFDTLFSPQRATV